jgi:hypothetical protein
VPSGWDPPTIKGGRIGKILMVAEEKWAKRKAREKAAEERKQRRAQKEQRRKKRQEKQEQKAKSAGSLLFSVATFGELYFRYFYNYHISAWYKAIVLVLYIYKEASSFTTRYTIVVFYRSIDTILLLYATDNL